jgi:predicted deacylase
MKNFVFENTEIAPGEQRNFNLEVAKLYDYTNMNLSVKVIHGKQPGPTMFVSAAMHGDEINGTEIVRRIIRQKGLNHLKGTLFLVPIVNFFGFNHKSRYLPDRRDLNRVFPGSISGSLASRLAYVFFNKIVRRCDYGIDLHTAAIHRSNLPQIRAEVGFPEIKKIAKAFGVPVIVNSPTIKSTLRDVCKEEKIKLLVYEGGEALRFNEDAIRAGLKGTLSVMQTIGMLSKGAKKTAHQSYIAKSSYWMRASESGICISNKKLGSLVEEGETIAKISDPFGKNITKIQAPQEGIIIGKSMIPLVNEGDALIHVATFKNLNDVTLSLANYQDSISD